MNETANTPNGSPAPVETPFYIPATNLPARPQRTLKHNDTFAVFDSHGDIGAASGGNDGLFHSDTRYLSHLELLIDGTQPLLLGSAIKDDNLNYYVDLTNPDIFVDDEIVLLKNTVHIGRTMYLFAGSLRERIILTNHGSEPVEFSLSLTFASDFADIFEVRGISRDRRGRTWREILGKTTVALSYMGLDDTLRQTGLSFEPAPDLLLDSAATYSVRLAPGARRTIFVAASSGHILPESIQPFFKGLVGLRRERQQSTRGITTVETSNEVVNEILCRAMADLSMLVTITPEGRYPYAGIPWYSTTFGRDGIITALQMLWMDPDVAAGVLRHLARYQATMNDPINDANPGKILHEMRGGEMAALREVPFELYYGSVDATPLFVVLAGCYAARTGDYALIRELWPAIERALAWIDGPGDPDGDGFVEYMRAVSTGLANQGWKDSHDSIFHADGRLAEGPIALVEVQGYVYAAKRLAASCARALGATDRAAELDTQADKLRERFEDAFWCEDIGTYALALDGAKAPCKVRTSNAGQVLFTGIAHPDRGHRVAAGLFDPDFYSGWGIRTVARGEARYNPMSYHNGSVWPHDNALIAQGLGRYGQKGGIGLVLEGLVRATTYMDDRRLPELFCGFRRRAGRGPTVYPSACSPQAWASGAPFAVLQAMLGLEFDHGARRIGLINPTVPAFVGDITIRNLSIGDATADFAVRQDGGAVSLQVLRATAGLQVSLVLDPST
ncbi:MAG: glycogen debranching N-terminal domain-containing protein [Hyphomicrobiaceae bacterium]